jgi:hypothetical protein
LEKDNIDLISVSTQTRINERWTLHDDKLRAIVNSYPGDLPFKNFKDQWDQYSVDSTFFQQGFLHVVTETVYNYPSTFVSEKTIKPIVNKRPFVLIGPPGSLRNLHNLGFKTFSQFWSEDYDSIIDNEKRLCAVIDVIESLCQKSISDLQTLCSSMEDVLNYNFNYHVNDFRHLQLNMFEQMCIKNLQPR